MEIISVDFFEIVPEKRSDPDGEGKIRVEVMVK